MLLLAVPCLCLVTRRAPWGEDGLVERVSAAVSGGVTMVQLREKDLPGGRLLSLARRLQQAVQSRALLVVNERVDVALACGADGVHLGEEALPVAEARRQVGDGVLLGRSIHSLEGALQAEQEGADYLMAGAIFPTSSKPGVDAAGVALLRAIGQRVRIPYLAIGGITRENVAQAMEAGAAGVAVISAVLEAPDPERAAAEVRQAMERAWTFRGARESSDDQGGH